MSWIRAAAESGDAGAAWLVDWKRGLRDVENLIRERHAAQEAKSFKDYDNPRPRSTYTPPPTGTAAFAKDFRDNAKTASDANRDAIRNRENGFRDTVVAIEKSPVIPSDATGIAFPKNWAALTKLRAKSVGPQMTPEEIKLLKTLNSAMSVNFDGEKFRSAIDYLQDRTGLTIVIDDASMKDAMIEYDDPVNFKVNKVAVRKILKKVLGDKSLTYIIKEGAIQVMTPKKASELLTVRTYPVDGLISSTFRGSVFQPVYPPGPDVPKCAAVDFPDSKRRSVLLATCRSRQHHVQPGITILDRARQFRNALPDGFARFVRQLVERR